MLVLGLVALVMSSGCIDIYSAKDVLMPHGDDETVYRRVTRLEIEQEFTITASLGAARVEDVENIYVKGDTRWLQFDIFIEIRTGPVPEPIKDLVEDRPRYLELTIWNPGGDRVFSYRYNETLEERPLIFNSPAAGLWKLQYEAQGIGHDSLDYHDRFSIKAMTFEPT